ncbi:hypothetical protein J5N97_012223 [Dioscorea zingiberensis]|uniref:Pentatricopeptide repeat-containing protein n=1 Tax=Dioscorea zingiberensis TaxID=325984 RepID=A0A9D5CPS5_9LILI|nr:hypothetical protein J5N97_012223 [Dioscorea zingiberensis]
MPSFQVSISPCNSLPVASNLHNHKKKKKKKKKKKEEEQHSSGNQVSHTIKTSVRVNGSQSISTNSLLKHYVRTGRMHDARAQFDAMPERTLVACTILMSGYVLHGHSMEALLLLHDMLHSPLAIVPDAFVLSAALRACASTGCLYCGQELHCLALKMGYLDDLFVANALVTMYSTCGSLRDSERLFREIEGPDLVSWSSMLSGYAKNGRDEQVLRLLGEMRMDGGQFDAFVLSIALKASANLGFVDTGIQLHCCTVKMGFDSCTFLLNSLMGFYGMTGRLTAMRQAFDGLCHKDLVSWNTTISCYADYHYSDEALKQFRLLMYEGFECDDYTLGSALQAVTDLSCLKHGKEIHGYAIKAGFGTNSYVVSALLDMYIESNGNNGLLPLKLFGYLHTVGEELLLDEFIMASVLKSCASRMDLETGKMVHSCILKQGMKTNPFISSSLVDMYAKCGILEASLWVFAGITEPGVVPWSAIIAGHCSNGLFQEALQLFQTMQSDGVKANEFTLTAVIQACAALRNLRSGKEIHCSLIRAGYESNGSVANSLISFYLEIRQAHQALKLCTSTYENEIPWNSLMQAFDRVIEDDESKLKLLKDIQRSNLQMNESMASYVLDAYRSPSLLHAGMQAHGYITKNGLLADHKVCTCLMNMYSRCGSIELAAKAFNQIPEKTAASWGSIISASVDHDCPSKALKLFTQMRRKNKSPDSGTFVSVLQACRQLGLVDEAFQIFISMSEIYGIDPSAEHYSCMVEILGCAGMVKEAEHFIGSGIPFKHKA